MPLLFLTFLIAIRFHFLSATKIMLNGVEIEYVVTCKYLGFHTVSHTEFSTSINEDLRRFFGSVNAILTSVQ